MLSQVVTVNKLKQHPFLATNSNVNGVYRLSIKQRARLRVAHIMD